jgi:SAM-dependent methyltransferase/uncharacterized protein YbaR (Trm112 family)
LVAVWEEDDAHIVQGVLHCPNAACQREYPIIDGVPILVRDIRSFLTQQFLPVAYRGDLSPEIESLLGDALGPGSALDSTRQHLSSYAYDHYRDFVPDEAGEPSVLRVLNRALALGEPAPTGRVLDLGCSVGRTTFELAAGTEQLVLGVDFGFAMLRCASGVLRSGRARFPLRRVGVVYDRVDVAVELPGANRVDFWAADTQDLPFAAGVASLATSLNLVDCVGSPPAAIAQTRAALCEGGKAVFATPFDWSSAATPYEAWMGGHSQRAPGAGAAEPVLHRLFEATEGEPERWRIEGVGETDWTVRLHARSEMRYGVHLLAARAVGAE